MHTVELCVYSARYVPCIVFVGASVCSFICNIPAAGDGCFAVALSVVKINRASVRL